MLFDHADRDNGLLKQVFKEEQVVGRSRFTAQK